MDLTRDVYPLNDTGTPQTCGDEREWSETFAQKSGTTAHLLCSLSTCITVLSYNIFAILLGHVALRNMPIYPSLSHTFVDTDLITTLSLAVLGSSVLTIPLFIAITLTFDGAAVHAVGSSAMRRAEAVVPRDILRPVSPRVHALLWEVWMISAAPMGSLLWDAIFLDLNPESYLDVWHATLSSVAGRLILLAARRVWRSRAQPDIEPEAAIRHFSASVEKRWRAELAV